MSSQIVVKSGYKNTEIGIVPEEWELKTFKEVCWVNQGLQININERKKNPSSRSKKYITIQYLKDGKDTEYIDEYSNSVCCEKEDILMTRTGNTGIVISNVEGVFHNNFFKINYDKKIINREYLIYFLKQKKIQKIILKKAGTSTIPDLNHNDFYSIPITYPKELEEQSRIAKAIQDMDKLILYIKKQTEKEKNLKSGTMQELFSGKRRLVGYDDKWEHKKLEDIVKDIRDGTHQTPTYVKNGIPFYSVENITDDNFTDTKCISKKEHQLLTKSFKIEKNDILMTRIGSIGDCKLINWDVDASFYVSLALLKLNEKISPEFFYQYSKSNLFKKELEIRSLQWAVPKKINLKNISEIPICVPTSKKEQTAIAQIISDMDSKIKELEQKRDKYIMIKDGMMQKLLTGEIRLR